MIPNSTDLIILHTDRVSTIPQTINLTLFSNCLHGIQWLIITQISSYQYLCLVTDTKDQGKYTRLKKIHPVFNRKHIKIIC
ncbi:hypothetical protein DLD82_04945 [Methanospirillum stamsii]|uniref:Uncharacterized protein n=1 Tax=Methanospirillum stamsii TaxID=1277351 RepID=A0A2V2NGG3_9EURY|nr:hypothetical protein DLD82_04945 [Methanospirillum stamsii]